MFDVKKVSIEWGGQTLTLETGKVARQADGAVIATLGETVVLCAVTAAKKVKEGQDFFPLMVDYKEKFYAAGKIIKCIIINPVIRSRIDLIMICFRPL